MERDDELALLDAVLEAARSGAGATVVIEGPAGIGKTSLLASARVRAALRGMTVLHARATPLEREYPMGVVRQSLEPAVRRHPDPNRLLAGAARLAESVVLEIPEGLEPAPVGVLHGLYWLTANLAESAPVMVAVDDAHWADEPSLQFLAYLARRVESLPVALVICTRVEVQSADTGALAELRGDSATELVRPRPLPVAGVESFLCSLESSPVEIGFARACHDATGGNPFLLGELVRALRVNGVPFTAAGAERVTEVTPPTVSRSVRTTLERLGPAARALARATAALGDNVELDLAAELAQIAMSDAASAAGDLVRAGILDDVMPLRFRHPILSSAVQAAQSAPERTAAHARAAELLRAHGAGAERIALQLMHVLPTGDTNVVDELRLAADRARARGAPATAMALLRRALAEPPAATTRGDLLLELGQAEYAAGRSGEAAAHLEEAHRCLRDPVTRGRVVIELFQAVASDLPSQRALGPLVDRTLTDLGDARGSELGLRLWAVQLATSEPGPAYEANWRRAAQLVGATPGEAIVLGHLAFPMMRAGATASEIGEIAERAALQADALLEAGATGLVMTAIALPLWWADRLDAAERLLDRAIAIAGRRGSTTEFAIAHTFRAWTHQRAGRLRDAEADARTSLAASGESGWGGAGQAAVIPLLGSLIDQGRIDEATQELTMAHGEDEVVDAPAMTGLLVERMRLRAAQGQHGRALDDWAEAGRRAERLFGMNADWIPNLIAAAEVHWAIGDRDACEALVAQALALARGWGSPGSVGQALHAAARLGNGDGAIDVLRDAVEHLQRSPVRLELARALVTLGGTLRRGGHRVDSREPLREGYEVARWCAALGLAETARAELRASGIRVRREVLTGADALTASERRIAEMAAAGASNAEIAQGLFLTVKTVEMHLTSAYRKLDIRSRHDLPSALTSS